MSDSALHFTKRELQRIFLSPRFWAVLLGAAVVLGVTGPFGTFESLPLLPRIAYWIAIAVLTMFCGFATVLFTTRWLYPRREPHWLGVAAAGALAGLPIAAVVWLINIQSFQSIEGGAIGFTRLLLYCIAISVVLSLLIVLAAPGAWASEKERAADTSGGPAPGETPEPPPLVARLPGHLRGKLLRLSMQDHYVEVHTDKGSTLVLMRLADAMRQTGGVKGLQIHRSHWVALDAVENPVRKEGRLFLRMRDGAVLPVSRSFRKAVREAGFG